MAKSGLQATNTNPGATQAKKNIILLSDGTGNSSSSIWRTNVWRVFQSLDLTDSSQVAFYEDGVGTSSFKPLAVVGGAFGFGLKRNVLDLYTFLCRNYGAGYKLRLMSVAAADGLVNEGRNLVIVALVGTDLHIRIFDASGDKVVDKAEKELVSGETLTALKKQLTSIPDGSGLSKKQKEEQEQKIIGDAISIAGHTQIFAFGFSRGAYTIRVITGLIANQGLVPYQSEAQLRRHAKAAYRAYRKDHHTVPHTEVPFRLARDGIIWLRDRVAKKIWKWTPYSEVKRIPPVPIRFLGLWDTVAAYGMPMEELTTMISQWIWPLELPDRELVPEVERACHAISIDDERTTFHPLIWNEGYDLRLMSVAAADELDGLVNESRKLVIVALVGTDLHIRIFDASGKKVVDKAEKELVSGEKLTALKKQLTPIPDGSGLSKEQKQKIIEDAASIAGHTLVDPLPRLNSAGKVGRWVEDERISQIWFAGVHANVGGGYPDDSLSHVPLSWMLGEAKRCGLRIKENPPWGPGATSPLDPVHEPDAFKQARSAGDKDGRQYDSRKGLAGYYRYGPRKIYDLCNVSNLDRWIGKYEVEVKVPKIHCSVLERIKNGAHGYAPFGLPARYAVVTADGEILYPSANPYERHDQANPSADPCEPSDQATAREKKQERVWDLVWRRRVNYFLAVGVSLCFALFPFFDDVKPDMGTGSWAAFLSPVIRLLGSVPPQFLTRPWAESYAAYPQYFAGLAIVFIALVLRGVRLGSQINDEMGELWREKPQQGSCPSGWVYKLRNYRWYRMLIGATKRHVVPLLLLLLLVYFGSVGISRALFTTGSSLGLICPGTQNDTLRSPPALATSPFMTSSLCWASGIRLEKGTPYRIVVERTQRWFVGSIPTTPLAFERENVTWPMYYGTFLLKRDLGTPWFGLIARTGRFGLDEHPLDLKPGVGLSNSAQITPRASGELFLFVNDAVIGFRWLARIFYGNNVGDAQIKVEPLPRCAAPPIRCPG